METRPENVRGYVPPRHNGYSESAQSHPGRTMQPQPSLKQQTPGKDARTLKHSAIEGLLRGFSLTNSSAEMTEVLEVLGAKGGLPSEVPVARCIALIEWLARRYFGTQPLNEGIRSVGMRMLHGYRQTLLGSIQLKTLNLMGPERLMRKMGDFIGRNTNFGERTSGGSDGQEEGV